GRYGYGYLDRYWTEPGRYPFLIRVDRKLAGFVLVRRGTYFPELQAASAELPYMVAEFFILRKYRRRGVGAYAAREVFDRFPGRWEVAEMPENTAAQAFWRRVIGEYTGGRYEEFLMENDRWRWPVQVFQTGINRKDAKNAK